MSVKGQHVIISTIFIVAIGLMVFTIFYFYSQGLFFQTKSGLQYVVDDHLDTSLRYVDITSATAKIDNNVQLTVSITNTGDSAIQIHATSMYIYKNDVLVFAQPNAAVLSNCQNPLPPGATCVFTFDINAPEYSNPDDIYSSKLVMYINNSRKESEIKYIG